MDLYSKTFYPAESVVILSDSYTDDDGLTDKNQGRSRQIGAHVDGTGMTASSSVANAVTALSPPVLAGRLRCLHTLIAQGGVQDWAADSDDVDEAADQLLAGKGILKVVIIKPPNTHARRDLATVNRALAEATELNGTEYVSTVGRNWSSCPTQCT